MNRTRNLFHVLGVLVAICSLAPETFAGTPTPQVEIVGPLPLPVEGTVSVDNLPAVQEVQGTVDVGNLPAVQEVQGTVDIGSLPKVQVAVTNNPGVRVVNRSSDNYRVVGLSSVETDGSPYEETGLTGLAGVNLLCQDDYGPEARICTTAEVWRSIGSRWDIGESAWVLPTELRAFCDAPCTQSTDASSTTWLAV